MLKRSNTVILNNRGVKEFGTIVRKSRRKDGLYYTILTERGIELLGITTRDTFPCYIEEELSIKYNKKINE